MTSRIDPADRAAIVELLYGYAWHFDRNEAEAVAGLFTEDCRIDYGPEMADIVGRDTIVASIQPGLSNLFSSSTHHISNAMIRADGPDTASGVAYVYAWHTYHPSGEAGEMWGQYHCRFLRTSEGWKIAELVLKVAGMKNFHRSTMHPIGRRA